MNPETGELVDGPTYDAMKPEEKKKFKPLPKGLFRAAKKKLKGAKRAMVSLTSGGKLSKWAAKKRKRKAARVARRRNRK